VTSVFNGYVTYQLPFGKGRMYGKDSSPVVNAVLGGWDVNAVFTAHGGFPITMQTGAATPAPGRSIPGPIATGLR
jgi:hypothetical protein